MVQNSSSNISEAERSVNEVLAKDFEVTLIKHDKFKALEQRNVNQAVSQRDIQNVVFQTPIEEVS